jgi:transposase
METFHILGIDIAKVKFDVALMVDDKFKSKVFTNTASGFCQLGEWLKKHEVQRLHACMEATNVYGNALANYLFEQGFTVSVVNPAQIKYFAKATLSRNKNDKLDAQTIARFCQVMKPSEWSPAPSYLIELQALVQRLQSLIEMQTQEKNRLGTVEAVVKKSVDDSLKHLSTQIETLREQIAQQIDTHPDLKQRAGLLESIPGVGDATIALVLSVIVDIHRFTHQSHLVAFAGLNPKQKQSGSSVAGKATLSKVGHAGLRKALYMPALVAMQYNPVLKQFAERLGCRHKSKMLIIGAVMRKLLVIIYGVLKSNKPFDPTLALAK